MRFKFYLDVQENGLIYRGSDGEVHLMAITHPYGLPCEGYKRVSFEVEFPMMKLPEDVATPLPQNSRPVAKVET